MKKLILALALAAVTSTSVHVAIAADAKSYQVTGPVVEVTDTTIVVQKGDDRWELARNKKTKGAADVKVGDKITVYYHMVATEVEKKDAKGGDKKK